MKKTIQATIALLTLVAAPTISAHCQVPCGIYADDNVFGTMHTDQETIEKAMKQVIELSKEPTKNANQIVRWVTNKEKHAQNIQNTVSAYFLSQRIKLSEADTDKNSYMNKIALLHKITVLAMKCKQTTDIENAQQLHKALNAFQAAYAGKKSAKAAHDKEHNHSGHTHSH